VDIESKNYSTVNWCHSDYYNNHLFSFLPQSFLA